MKVIVITGSTRGIGFGLAREFLKRGCAVVVSGRKAGAVQQAVAELSAVAVPSLTQAPLKAQAAAGTSQLYLAEASTHPERVLGQPCDVTRYEQVQALWDAAQAKFGRVDIWINNAGLAHSDHLPLWEQSPELMQAVVNTNLLGSLYGLRVAAQGMTKQGGGFIYDFEGFGSNGRVRAGLGLYGSTKAAVGFLGKALAADAKQWNAAVTFGAISPGMVTTDMLTGQYEGRPDDLARARRVFNILADKVETVAPFIADGVLAGQPRIVWLTPGKIFWRFLTANFNQRDLFSEIPMVK